MQIRSPYRTPATNTGFGQSRLVSWFQEWIANKGQYCLLDCECFEDLKDRSLTVIHALGNQTVHVWCERCDLDSIVIRTATMTQYLGLPPSKMIGDEPEF